MGFISEIDSELRLENLINIFFNFSILLEDSKPHFFSIRIFAVPVWDGCYFPQRTVQKTSVLGIFKRMR